MYILFKQMVFDMVTRSASDSRGPVGWILHAWSSTHWYGRQHIHQESIMPEYVMVLHYPPPRWMKPYRHAEAHGHRRGMQCKSSWKFPFNDGIAWQFTDCKPIMEFTQSQWSNTLFTYLSETERKFKDVFLKSVLLRTFVYLRMSGLSGGCLVPIHSEITS